MADTFIWKPTVASSSGSTTLKTRKAQFGDGYAQRVADGLNNASSSFSLQFIGDAATISAILAFLRAHAGATAFLWTPLLWTAPALFTCETWSEPTKDGNTYTITATFDQTYAP
ncbi:MULTISPECIES: phage tail protein [unclassified Caballeronia]|uniref:phage tail protein n=1 Tax=unclassified Caballeronia TaxID=2646786 RepID=UPI00285A7FBA|nr:MULTISPECIES: phage tail protein [unclassified Caballeronia]MDR5774914.1 phage tail protein [Caballeronia sp. LZ002]MDR5850350.1 phage tail protein [Caballeronia sp. LZ003]